LRLLADAITLRDLERAGDEMGLRNEELLAQARISAPLTAGRGEETILVAKASGCRVFDADSVAYIDFLGGGGANLLGYANQYVLDAVRRASSTGLSTGYHVVQELELIEQLEALLPMLSPWMLTTSETDAWELALRWCRRDTGRQRIVVFDGNRRGAVEAFAVASAGAQGISQPELGGIPLEAARLVRVAPWGDIETFEAVIDGVGVDTAAVILDPIAANAGIWVPDPEFLRVVQERTRAVGARLVLDETITGFRLARGGAMETLGITPDVVVFGGALGGGVAQLGAVAWDRALAATPGDSLPPPPPPVAVLAAGATVSVLRNDMVHQRLEERGVQLQAGVEALAERFSRPLRIARMGSIFSCVFAKKPLAGPFASHRVDHATWARFARAARENGVLLPSRSPAASFLSHAHGVKDVEQALVAMEAALRKMQKEDEA
jgi:glutamate-1-semialdehyde 2,1-aminomutase